MSEEAADRFQAFNAVVGIILIIFLIMLLANGKGKSLAEAEHLNIKSATPATAKIVTINYLNGESQPAEVSGTLIQPSSVMIALYSENDVIIELPVSRVISIRQNALKTLQVIDSK